MAEGWLAKAKEFATSVSALWAMVIALVTGAFGFGVWVSNTKADTSEVDRKIAEASGKCVRFPDPRNMRLYHSVTDALPGGEAIVTWRDLYRQKACVRPCLIAKVTNGDGIPRKVREISIASDDRDGCAEGLEFPPGPIDLPPYAFTVPETAEPGCATFELELDFRNGQPAEKAPILQFYILNPDGSEPEERCV